MKMATAAIGLVVIVGVVVVVAVAPWRSKAPVTPPPAADDQVRAPPSPTDESARVVAPPVSPAPPQPSARPPIIAPMRRDEPTAMPEPQLMATLREMGGTAPQRSIDLAREGQRRFPNSADAAERDFIVVQSLVNLKRFHEAQDEARAMVRKYPDNQFALDAQRHLLVYPLDQPSREEMQERIRRDQ